MSPPGILGLVTFCELLILAKVNPRFFIHLIFLMYFLRYLVLRYLVEIFPKTQHNISVTFQMLKNYLNSSKAYALDCTPVIVLKKCEPELSYILDDFCLSEVLFSRFSDCFFQNTHVWFLWLLMLTHHCPVIPFYIP